MELNYFYIYDTTFLIKNDLTIKYSIEDMGQKKKIVNLEKILN